jgi:4-carboxymuconolactone decarboxylase
MATGERVMNLKLHGCAVYSQTRERGIDNMGGDTRKELRDFGLSIRRQVLGEKYVDNALRSATDFNQPLQDLLNEYCWGAIWGREGLTRKERSMINLAMLTALGRTHEVEIHVRGALNNGLTKKQIAEVLMQTAIYCGVPAAVDSFRVATKVIAEHGE